ncbi:hypothetical protein BALAC2494_01997 [Bifidobacterium animalis subsp. lactis CNCM I-2494]|uniref:Uncharacterized protein n=1 Tax=Bifidobacterium animalis subsp. lactis CNCM I-2494 TaxID=1042403 RepID=A0A806FMU6_BIFAN|nr:hypothetical protein BALAC2494_01997 [Bifidobacterium animalis subsp. lactis CNCM I-2494]
MAIVCIGRRLADGQRCPLAILRCNAERGQWVGQDCRRCFRSGSSVGHFVQVGTIRPVRNVPQRHFRAELCKVAAGRRDRMCAKGRRMLRPELKALVRLALAAIV